MICKNCGRNQSSNSRFCANCGYPMTEQISAPATSTTPVLAPIQKSNRTWIVVLVILLVLALFLLAGVLIFKANESAKQAAEGEAPHQQLTIPSASPIPTSDEPVLIPTPTAAPTPKASPTPKPSNGADSPKKDYFETTAGSIEEYSRQYLDSATSESTLLQESKEVFEKWDVLLNEVYRYLKIKLAPDIFSALEKEELEWIRQKEDAMYSLSDADYYLCGIEFTRERCYYLISLID